MMRPRFILASLLLLAGACSALAGGRYVSLGPADEMALDQPRVTVLVDPFGPDEVANQYLLDTGSQGTMHGYDATDSMVLYGYQTQGTYDETGIAGSTTFDVSTPYTLTFAGTDGTPYSIENQRMMSTLDPTFDLGGFSGIVGMPAMHGRVTTMDLANMVNPNSEWGIDFMGVHFASQVPASNGHRYSVAVNMVDFPPNPDHDPTGPIPTLTALPFVQASIQGTKLVPGRFLIDTGAQMSIISKDMAIAAGLDTNGNGSLDDEAIDMIPVGGIGGEVEAPLVALSKFRLPTQQGVDMVWTTPTALVVDIAGIDGIFGADLMTSGWGAVLFGETSNTNGYFNQIHLDFTQSAGDVGTMYLDMDAAYDHVTDMIGGDANADGRVRFADYLVVEANFGKTTTLGWEAGDFNGDGKVSFADYLALEANFGKNEFAQLPGDANGDGKVSFADYLILEANFGKSGLIFGQGDFNNDGRVTFADYLILESHFGETIPEPATIGLLLLGLPLLRRKS